MRAGRLVVIVVAVVGWLAGAAVPAQAGCAGSRGDPLGAVIAGTGPDAEVYRLVFIGRVTKVHRAVRDDRLGVVTPVEVSVEAVLRGDAGAVLRTRNPGGMLPDGSGVGVGDGVVLEHGHRYVIAARVEPDGTFSAGGCGLTRVLSQAQAAALAVRYHAQFRPVPDGAVQPTDPPGVDWRGRIAGGVALLVALVAGVVVVGRSRQRQRNARLGSGWVQQ
jgi:hypothetical protein